jgi:hypothetical protein
MKDPYKVYWNNVLVGEVIITGVDMWYMDSIWQCYDNEESKTFEQQASMQIFKDIIQDPEASKVLKLVLVNDKGDGKIYCLVTMLEGNNLSMGQVVSPEAIQKFFPDR